jgi:hypothetical protein
MFLFVFTLVHAIFEVCAKEEKPIGIPNNRKNAVDNAFSEMIFFMTNELSSFKNNERMPLGQGLDRLMQQDPGG